MSFPFLMLLFVISVTSAEGVSKSVFEKHQVIFLPEEHTSKEDHEFQLRFIRFLHSKGQRLFIAMEMFQQPFQPILEDYVACRIEEEEMLKRTEYARRWGFDPALYRDIWRFAKEKGIRIVAINLPSELVQRIRREGLERVRDDSLPDPIIPQTEKERQELKKVLAFHPKVEEKRFFDVQNAWDNGMALAIARLSERHPDHIIVVLVGRGHAEDYESGIPRKLKILKPDISIKILKRENLQRDFLFSIDFSSESSSANSTMEPNCRP
ncbi:MAG: ChaN family lipoprotein [Aquificaceae bacterium]|nr:ChaN family lipoprotein [Aquificaceae bacterium]MDW8295189.1 ChaN family lipoprotein [Aquificaceae bacterium]